MKEKIKITYREAEERDADGLLLHLSRVGGESDFLTFGKEGFGASAEREARFIRRFIKNPDEIMLVAMDGDKVVGNGVIERERIPRLSHRARLSLTVLEDYSHRGIGTQLMEMLVSFSRKSGAKIIYLECHAQNSRALSLYEKFGFKISGTMNKYFRIGEKYYDAHLMELVL
ncbi:MAG: GNAT family N-acetyltransferase [Clostridia bacterium]|nr:GNAT family N-acetyltransferase [Clostridia bacterium]